MAKDNSKKQVALIVLDGWGYREEKEHNAIAQAKTPFFDYLWNKYPHTLLEASGESVGLPAGQMGNSEIGHMTIGAGKVIYTDLVRISKAAEAGEFATNSAFIKLFGHVKKNDSTLHIMGLVSPGGIHSHSDHLYAFLKTAKEAGISKIAVHVFTDGRDTPPKSASKYVKEFEDFLAKLGVGFIASVSGRYYAMDRDNNWDRLAKFENIIFEDTSEISNLKPSEYLEKSYSENVTDEHVVPVAFENVKINKNDGVFFFNFRSDRSRMLSNKISAKVKDLDLCFVTMTKYEDGLNCEIAFPPVEIETTLANEVSKAGLKQAHVAETEKFAHATFFLNGGREKPHQGEDHILVSSRKDVATHDLAPKMKASEIADKAIEEIEKGTDFIFINFANADMVGHTAKVDAIIEGIEEVDLQLKKVVDAILEKNGIVFITADHGNAEINFDKESGQRHTAHTTSLVPAIVTLENIKIAEKGSLADIAPTILSLLEIKKPEAMTGKNLIS
jgi:2,3-bisphosphoglycerate-independent phosphoglycerate mutase